jgi:hypothetical protein
MREWGDVKVSVFNNIDKIQTLMRQAVGLDEYSTQTPGPKQTATVAGFMRESTIEGVKLFLYLLTNAYVFHFDHYISMIKQFWDKRSVVPDRVLAEIDDFADTDFPVMDEDWIDPKTGDHRLWPGLYTVEVDQSSTIASSAELRAYKDKNIWEMVKDMEDEFVDKETGQTYTIKKFKILMKVLEDASGWQSDKYIVKKKTQESAPILPENNLGGEVVTKAPAPESPVGAVSIKGAAPATAEPSNL